MQHPADAETALVRVHADQARAHVRLAAIGMRELVIHAHLADVARDDSEQLAELDRALILDQFAELHRKQVRSTRKEVWAHRELAAQNVAGTSRRWRTRPRPEAGDWSDQGRLQWAHDVFMEGALQAQPERLRLIRQSASAQRVLAGMGWREAEAIGRAFQAEPQRAQRVRVAARAHGDLARLADRKASDHLRLAGLGTREARTYVVGRDAAQAAQEHDQLQSAWAHRQLAARSAAWARWNRTCASPYSLAALLHYTMANGSRR
jgi:hypothetical protein